MPKLKSWKPKGKRYRRIKLPSGARVIYIDGFRKPRRKHNRKRK